MAEPWTFDVNPPTFTFENGQVTFEVVTNIETLAPPLPEPVIVESVHLETPGTPVDLGISGVAVPLPVVEHLESHFLPSSPDLLLHI
jgi:hypothetical protein